MIYTEKVRVHLNSPKPTEASYMHIYLCICYIYVIYIIYVAVARLALLAAKKARLQQMEDAQGKQKAEKVFASLYQCVRLVY